MTAPIRIEQMEHAGPGDRLRSTYELPCGHERRVRVSDTTEEDKRCRTCKRRFRFTPFARPHPDFRPESGLLLTWHRCVELVDGGLRRPAGVEWDADLSQVAEGAPELRGGHLQASVHCSAGPPDRSVHHVVVWSGLRSEGPAGWVAACAPGWLNIPEYRRDATDVPENLRCDHPNCADLFAVAGAGAIPAE